MSDECFVDRLETTLVDNCPICSFRSIFVSLEDKTEMCKSGANIINLVDFQVSLACYFSLFLARSGKNIIIRFEDRQIYRRIRTTNSII